MQVELMTGLYERGLSSKIRIPLYCVIRILKLITSNQLKLTMQMMVYYFECGFGSVLQNVFHIYVLWSLRDANMHV